MVITRRVFFSLFAFVLSIGFVGLGFSSADAAPATGAKTKLAIVKTVNWKGELRFEIVDEDIVTFLKKDLDNEYKEAKKQWQKERKAWVAAYGKGVPFPKPEPLRPYFKVLCKKEMNRSDAKIELQALRSKGPFCVVQVVRGKKKEEPEVILTDEIKPRQYALKVTYARMVEEWVREREQFLEEHPGKEFTKALPPAGKLKVLKNGVRTMEKARAYLAKYKK